MNGDRTPLVVALWCVTGLLITLHLVWPTGPLGDTTYLLGVWTATALAWIGTLTAPAGRRLVPALSRSASRALRPAT